MKDASVASDSSLPDHVHDHASRVRPKAMLDLEHTLPRPGREAAADDRNRLARARDGAPLVRGAVVRALVVVLIRRIAVGREVRATAQLYQKLETTRLPLLEGGPRG